MFSYQLTFEERPGYLYAHIKADVLDEETAHEYLTEIGTKCQRDKHKRLLLERDVPTVLDDSLLFSLVNYTVSKMLGRRVAVFNKYSHINEDIDFAVLIAKNRGADYEVFNSFESAEKWLLDG